MTIAKSNKIIGLFIEITNGLKGQPAYLLIFGVCGIFLLSGFGNSIAGIIKNDHILTLYGLISFIAALLSSVIVVKHIERKSINSSKDNSPGDLITPIDKDIVSNKLPDNRKGYFSQSEIIESYPPKIDNDFENAKNIWLLGIHQSHILIRYYQKIKNKIMRGDNFHILLLDPYGSAYKMTAMRFPGKFNPAQEQERIKSSLQSYCELQKIAPDRMEIRTIDFLLPYGGFLFDVEDFNGSIYIQRYTFRIHGGHRKPKFIYQNTGNQWYDFYKNEVKELWKASQKWKSTIIKENI
ncbi:hypothetical protein ES708_07855 [subsurface metagenome]